MFDRQKMVWIPYRDMLGGKKHFRKFQRLVESYGVQPLRERFPAKEIDLEISNLEKLAAVAQLPYVPALLKESLRPWCASVKLFLLCAAEASTAGENVDKKSIQKVIQPSWKAKCRQAAEFGNGLQEHTAKEGQR